MDILLPLLVLPLLLSSSAASEVNTIHPYCRSACGDVAIPYPFGIGANCSMPGFEVECYDNKPFLKNIEYKLNGSGSPVYPPELGDAEFININLISGQARVYQHMSSVCYNDTTEEFDLNRLMINVGFQKSPYKFSYTLNKFTIIGCQIFAYMVAMDNATYQGYQSGCLVVCPDRENTTSVSLCSGIGCCQTSISKGLNFYYVNFDEEFNNAVIWSFSRCGYAFLVEEGSFVFDPKYVTTDALRTWTDEVRVPVVLDWAIGDDWCPQVAQVNSSSYACLSEHSHCVDSTNGPGYRCACSSGYKGNPYLVRGCHDINECDHPEEYPCHGICINSEGNFSCTCPTGTEGDPLRKGGCTCLSGTEGDPLREGGCTCLSGTEGDPLREGGCKKISKKIPLWLGFVIGLLVTFVLVAFMQLVYERVKLIRAKRKCFQQNGGLLLQEQINAHQGVKFKIFTIEEIKRATDNFDAGRVLGEGGHGLVYRGSLADNREVAIKRSRIADQKQKKEFAKELYIGSLINHRNVVNILGCCLEVEVPLLVYEFVSKGDLFNYIHIKKGPFPLDFRLKVAGESAAALAYLHSDASPSILHGDVKSSNILLDEGYAPKVSDFGTSLLDKDELATHAQGTWGYIDPEYVQTCLLTDKSDVYSFAVVLLEVLTRKRVVLSDRSGAKVGLVSVFLSSVRENKFREMLDSEIRHELGNEQVEEMAEILTRCLSPSGESRPAMKEVAAWVERLRKCTRPSSSSAGNDINSGESISNFWMEDSTIDTSTESRMAFSIGTGRY